jgi:hypothetical protein
MKKHMLLASAAILALVVASPSFAIDNDSSIDQLGAIDSSVLVLQNHNGGGTNKSTVKQQGRDDEAYVDQEGPVSNESIITQTGIAGQGNVASTIQKGTGDKNYSKIEQTVSAGGTSNGAFVFQGAKVTGPDGTTTDYVVDLFPNPTPPPYGAYLPAPQLDTPTAASSTSTIKQGSGGNFAAVNQY